MGIFTTKPVDKRKILEKLSIDKFVLPANDYRINEKVATVFFVDRAITFDEYMKYFNKVEPSHPIREFSTDFLVTIFEYSKEFYKHLKDKLYRR